MQPLLGGAWRGREAAHDPVPSHNGLEVWRGRTHRLGSGRGGRVDGRRADGGRRGHGGRFALAVLAVALAAVAVLLAGAAGVVGLDVLAQVVRPHEPLVAHRTRKPLLTCVGSEMTL